MTKTVYDFSAKLINGKEISMDTYRNKVLLIVNTASKCGFTKQYEGLQELYDQYADRGLVILAFPSNQFIQEPDDNETISTFCKTNYGVTFDLFEKVQLSGENGLPLFKYLAEETPGFLGFKFIKWNFTKFLVNKKGIPVKRFSPSTAPEKLALDIEELLNE